MNPRPRLSGLIRCPSGAAAIEFAMVGLLLVCLLLATIEFGRALFLYNQMARAADIATRHVLLDPPETSSDLERLETAIRDSLAIRSGDFQVELQLPTEARVIPMTLRQPLSLLVPDLVQKNLTMTVNRQVSLP